MKTVTICGSMRFAEEMQEIALDLEIHHNMNVLQCVYNTRKIDISDVGKDSLQRAHREKIDLSDAIYVIDIDGYIGESVKQEIAYSKEHGKEVIFHTQFIK